MSLNGWDEKYEEILNEFGYNKTKDAIAAKILNFILKNTRLTKKIESRIKNKTVFVIGAGPSLIPVIPYLKKFKNVTKIVADGATTALVENKIKPDLVVTDLDGNMNYLRKAADSNSIIIVHAHGDNIPKLPYAFSFKYCVGTTETEPFDKIQNYGGFTDGDRCVFLARYFGARNIILFGMDFGPTIGRYSKEGRYNKSKKIKKLKRGRLLLEWLATMDANGLYNTSGSIKGFKKIRLVDLQKLVRT